MHSVFPSMRVVLEERGINTRTLVGDQMREILAQHDDFKNEKSRVEHFLDAKGRTVLFLPKFHPELNPIERVWAQSKCYTKAYCKYNLPSLRKNILRKNIPLALDSVSIDISRIIIAKCGIICFRTCCRTGT